MDRLDRWTVQDLRTLARGYYFTDCEACGWKGTIEGGLPDSVCPSCGGAVYALPGFTVSIPNIHKAVNHADRDIAAYTANPFTSAQKIQNGMVVSALKSLPEDASPEHRRETVEYAKRHAQKIVQQKGLE